MTPRGQSAQPAGDGLYRYDTVFAAAGNVGVDAVVLTLDLPLLVTAWQIHRNGSPRGSLLLTGALGHPVYVYASYALGVAYNPAYLVYIALFSASLFGFVAAFGATHRAALAAVAADAHLPHRSLARFLSAAGAVTAIVWVAATRHCLLRGTAPELLDVYTTPVTFTLDLAVVAPAAALEGMLVRRRDPIGYLLAAPLLVTIVLLLPTIAVSTALQAHAGISVTVAEVVSPVAGFGVLGVIGAWLLVRLLRAVPMTPVHVQEAADVHAQS